MPKIRGFAAFGVLGLITGCGGGGGGSGVATFPPPPAAQVNSTLTDLQYTESFRGETSEMGFQLSRSTGGAVQRGQWAGISTDGGTVRYDAASQSYTVSGLQILPSETFGPTDKIAVSSNNILTSYQKKSGNQQVDMTLFNPGTGNSQLALTYTSYGAYQRITDNGDLDVDTAFFTFGVRTTDSQMPRSGTATYATKIDGQYYDPTGVYALTGASSFMADFSAATFAFSMTPVGQNVVSGVFKNFDTQDIKGTIQSYTDAGNTFKGNGFKDGTSSGINGFFYGPAAAEIGGTFTLSTRDGRGIGAIVGKKN